MLLETFQKLNKVMYFYQNLFLKNVNKAFFSTLFTLFKATFDFEYFANSEKGALFMLTLIGVSTISKGGVTRVDIKKELTLNRYCKWKRVGQHKSCVSIGL